MTGADNEQQDLIADHIKELQDAHALKYGKNIKATRNLLYFLAAIFIITKLIFFNVLLVASLNFILSIGLGLLFLAMALLSYKKPFLAFLLATVVYSGNELLLLAEVSFGSIFSHIMRLLVIYFLVRGTYLAWKAGQDVIE